MSKSKKNIENVEEQKEIIEQVDETKELEQSEQVVEIKEQEQPVKEKSLLDLFIDYIQNIFSSEVVNSYLESLEEDKRRYVNGFVDGYKAASKKDIVGVYDINYIVQFRLTKELLEKLNLNLQVVDVQSLNFKFVIVEQ